MFHHTDGGLPNVWLTNGYVLHQTKYGKGISFHDSDGLTHAICKALSNKPGRLTGAEFRYLRCGLLLSQKMLGKKLGFKGQAVGVWEKSGNIPKAAEYFLRSIYLAAANGDVRLSTTLELLNLIEKNSNTKIIFTEINSEWKGIFQNLDDVQSALV